jgi:hypothetical protein
MPEAPQSWRTQKDCTDNKQGPKLATEVKETMRECTEKNEWRKTQQPRALIGRLHLASLDNTFLGNIREHPQIGPMKRELGAPKTTTRPQ